MDDIFESGPARWGFALRAKTKLLIIGAGGHGKSVAEAVLLANHFNIVGFLDDSQALNTKIWDFEVLGSTDLLYHYQSSVDYVIVALGNNDLRQRLITNALNCGFKLATVIHPSAIVSPTALIGDGSTIMAGAIIGTEAILGIGTIVNCGAVVDHHAKVCDYAHLGVNACMAGGTILGTLAWMKAGSAIGYGVNVPEATVLMPGQTLN